MTDLRVVRADGDPRACGRAIGLGFWDLIERLIDFYYRYFDRRGVTLPELQDLLAPYLSASETLLPAYVETIKGMAEGAMVPVWELFAINAFEELEPLLESPDGRPLFLWRKEGYRSAPGPAPAGAGGARAERCSTFTVSGPGYTFLGHNEHWLAGDTGNAGVVIEAARDGVPAVVSPTVVCCLPAVGMNAARGAQGINSMTASDDGVGVPRVLISRYALEAADRSDAVARANFAGRAGGYSHVFAFPRGDTFAVETTGSRVAVIEGPGPHTNHYLDPGLAELAPEPSEGSLSRFERLTRVLREEPTDTPEGVMRILRDHDAAPQAVCLHPEEGEDDEASAVVFSMVADVEHGRMWVAAGNPCETEYEEVDLAGVV